jgi:hypothetical protein
MKNGSQAANQMFSAFPEMTLTALHESLLPLVVLLAEKIFETRRSHFSKVFRQP